jgi:hypothetical protein
MILGNRTGPLNTPIPWQRKVVTLTSSLRDAASMLGILAHEFSLPVDGGDECVVSLIRFCSPVSLMFLDAWEVRYPYPK